MKRCRIDEQTSLATTTTLGILLCLTGIASVMHTQAAELPPQPTLVSYQGHWHDEMGNPVEANYKVTLE